MHAAAERAGITPFWWQVRAGSPLLETATAHDVVLVDHAELADQIGYRPGEKPGAAKASGALSFRFVEDAISAAKGQVPGHTKADAVVTAPISKHAWSMAGHGRWPGHTELLAERFGANRSRMMFVAPKLRVILATAHVPLIEVASHLTIGRVHDTIDLGHEACLALGIERPRIAVAGLNPHAGEEGLLGDEEKRIIAPAIAHAQRNGIDVRGAFPGDTVFNAALKGQFDLVVAMYHDQGLIPVKLLAFDSAVNVTTGLPVWRTSPDHGTAYDIAGKNLADSGSMEQSLQLAVRLSKGALSR
jgi:4-hydroxythreonine-4-phosphate dehydrogenase